MTRFVIPTSLTLLLTAFSNVVYADVNIEQMSNEALLECANVSNVQSAVPEHRASFRNYLMSVRNYSFSKLSSAELEFKAKNKNTTDVLVVYQSQCRELGEHLYSIGY
ncbi:hypothetical protein L3V31_18700 [Vibrio sp. J1-1]|uniref:hypothetical protein n=1 Tax=Vibrio sp. J1-1 TaxID=2912251 RepID=UPI001F1B1F2F|nr:hypothetical protein [Vibrio sp. J1-1]MBR9874515.1 hypothetical protein [Vibrionaceae bacterium]MCF7483729.1 hypothetical protein [Vibrio sp. J1-1]